MAARRLVSNVPLTAVSALNWTNCNANATLPNTQFEVSFHDFTVPANFYGNGGFLGLAGDAIAFIGR
jgi:hypothetical protein